MNICNCPQDLDTSLCDVPHEWREGIVKALCLTLQSDPITCKGVRNCQTLTSFSAFTIQGTEVSISYINERGTVEKSTFDLEAPINSAGEDLDNNCLSSFDTPLSGIIQIIIDAYCECCPTTTTTSTTTTTTVCYEYYLANEFGCIGLSGNCAQVDTDILVAVPCGFVNIPGTYYPSVEDNTQTFQITSSALPDDDAVLLNTGAGSLTCNLNCLTTTTTTTSTSTTTSTTCCPITETDIVEITTTSTTTTTTSA